jgi:CubicO group peptidase (beta-lactamase class C family)
MLTTSLMSTSVIAGGPPLEEGSGEWPRVTPDSVGLDPAALAALDADFRSGAIPLVDSILILRCGSLAYERHYAHDYATIYGKQARTVGPLNPHLTGPYNYFDPAWHPYWHGTDAHTMQSVTKSVTAATIGAAMLHGDFRRPLDTPVLHWFDAARVEHVDARKRAMTLRDLLTMTSGLAWNEDLPYADPRNAASRMEGTKDWVKFVIDRPMAYQPGTHFAYSSGVSELLAAIFRKETGQDIEDYARNHLFEPLGIHDYHWKRTPLGEVDTEGGLFLRDDELAKLGELYRGLGMWHGVRLIDAEWIRDSVSPLVEVGEGYRYGYQWWLVPYGDGSQHAWSALGFGGQYLFVMPEDGIVAVSTGWAILDPKYYEKTVLDKLRTAVRPHVCPEAAPGNDSIEREGSALSNKEADLY